MGAEPGPAVEEDVAASDMRRGGGCKEERKTRNVGWATVPACGLAHKERLLSCHAEAKGRHLRREEAWTDGVYTGLQKVKEGVRRDGGRRPA